MLALKYSTISYLLLFALLCVACDSGQDTILETDEIIPPQGEFTCDDLVPAIWDKGDGTLTNPYLLENASHLFYLAQEVNDTLSATPKDFEGKYFKITQNIDLKSCPWTPIGGEKGQTDKAYLFNGHLDGNNKPISNLYVARPNMELAGFFGKTGRRSSLKNLKFVDGEVIGKRLVGGIAGIMYNELMENCSFEGSVIGDELVGGLVGLSEVLSTRVMVKDCYFKGTLSGKTNTGGIIGFALGARLANCYSDGTITGQVATGGLLGYCGNDSKIMHSYALGEVMGDKNVGGLVGNLKTLAMVEDCYFSGSASGMDNVGGIVGAMSEASGNTVIQRCQNSGSIEASSRFGGGIVGYSYNNSIALSFNTGKISGNKYIGGICGGLETTSTTLASIINCYNTGTIAGNSYGCGIAGRAAGLTDLQFCYSTGTIEEINEGAIYYGITPSDIVTGYKVTQCFYLEGSVYTQTSQSTTSQHMKSEQFIEDLTDVTGFVPKGYKIDTDEALNDGYPILIWQ